MPIDLQKTNDGENAEMGKSGGGTVNESILPPNPDTDLNPAMPASSGGEVNESAWSFADVSGTPEEMGK